MQLNKTNISKIGTQIPVPTYDRQQLKTGIIHIGVGGFHRSHQACLLYTSDAADDTPCVDLGGRRIIKKKK